MPSDARVVRALEMLAPAIARYRSAVARTSEELRGRLATGQTGVELRAAGLRHELGPFGADRLDADHLAAVLGDGGVLNAEALQRFRRASAVLDSLIDTGQDLFCVTVPAGGDLLASVSAQLAVIGRAFAAARLASAAVSGSASPGLEEETALDAFPFDRWSASERALTPALVVTIDGTDLNAHALAPLIDGTVKALLVIDGPCDPATLMPPKRAASEESEHSARSTGPEHAAPGTPHAAQSAEQVSRLAAWLLQQADLEVATRGLS